MSIYISNVEMPKEHPLYITLHPDGSVHVWDSYNGNRYGTQAIFVPPHGRGIDADALLNHEVETWTDHRTGKIYLQPIEFAERIKCAPTIIPPDKEAGK
jgi:hypothetical protein